ncbi:MAG: TolC family protein [Acidobacteriota bacterium]
MRSERSTPHPATSLGLFLVILISSPSWAEGSREPSLGQRLTLRRAVEQVMANHSAVAAEEINVQAGQIALKRVRHRQAPALDFKLKTGLVPEAKGDVLFSPDEDTDTGNLGPFYDLELRLVQPLATFGKTAAARSVAAHDIEQREISRHSTAEKLGFEVIRAFWQLDSAVRGLALAQDLREDYEKLLSKVERGVQDPESDIDDTKLFQVRSLEFQVNRVQQDSLILKRLTELRLQTLLGLDAIERFEIAAVPTPDFPMGDDTEQRFISLADGSNAAIRKLEAVVATLDARLSLARASGRPDLFIAGSAHYADAPNRTDQKNPFVFDPYNTYSLGGFVGLNWDLDFVAHRLEARQRTLELEESRKKLEVLKQEIAMEVSTAVAQAEQDHELLDTVRRSLKAAKSWLRLSWDNWDLGIGDVDRLVDASNSYYQLSGIAIQRESRFNLALARLALASGRVEMYLEWTENGVVSIN